MANIQVNINQEIATFQGNNDPTILIVGMKNTLGLAQDGELIQVNGENDIAKYFGSDSHIAQALRKAITINDIKYFVDNRVIVYGLAVNENSVGTADSRTLTFSGEATNAGEIKITIYDSEYTKTIQIVTGETKTTLVAKIKSAFDSYENFPFTITISGVDNEILTFTSNVKGGVFKNFAITTYINIIDISCTIGTATIGDTLPTGIKTYIKNAIDEQKKRFWCTCIEPAFLNDDPTIYDLIKSYKNVTNSAKQTQNVNVKYDTKDNLETFLAEFNSENISFATISNLTKDNYKGNNITSELNMAVIMMSVDCRKNTPGAVVSDLGLQGSGSIANIPLSICDLILPLCDIKSEFIQDDIIALSELNCAILSKPKGQSYVTLLSGKPDFRTTLTILSSGAKASYKYFGDINAQAYLQDYLLTAFKTIDFYKKTITSGNAKTDKQLIKDRAINLILYRIKECANLGIVAYSDEIQEILIDQLNRKVIINFINRSISGEVGIEFIKELLKVILDIVPIASYNN